ncbi:hypothetical protein [Aquimarina sp. AU119]|uniref:hypothetical protein n=1 Tax=Aquimarina sp. AU119 TaxID=2108528 RepID=UPI000D68A533|nr:hypothetical protein [Aquimarina sp. AU119]
MKKVIYSITILVLIFLGSSCAPGQGKDILIMTPDGIEDLKEVIFSNFGEDKQVHSLNLLTKNDKSGTFEMAQIMYPENEKVFSQVYIVFLGKVQEPTEIDSDITSGTVALKDIGFDRIEIAFKDSQKLVEEKTQEFTNYRLVDWGFSVESDNKIVSSFTIVATKKEKGNTIYGERIIGTQEFEFEFELDGDGTVKSTSGLIL